MTLSIWTLLLFEIVYGNPLRERGEAIDIQIEAEVTVQSLKNCLPSPISHPWYIWMLWGNIKSQQNMV